MFVAEVVVLGCVDRRRTFNDLTENPVASDGQVDDAQREAFSLLQMDVYGASGSNSLLTVKSEEKQGKPAMFILGRFTILAMVAMAYVGEPCVQRHQAPAHKKPPSTAAVLRGWGSGQYFAYQTERDVRDAYADPPSSIKTDQQAQQYILSKLSKMYFVDSGTRAAASGVRIRVSGKHGHETFEHIKIESGKYAGKDAWIETKYVHRSK